ncbi:putative PAMP-induced secreted peptide 1 [Helianthus annuus]|uniref:PAMP-induced secreted peptide 1 n=1 Tax=Helianthus annuus TaxID=4232 RepID=A0A9K3E6M7_HELAN|nr:putative PAMP-induced secreted peptide 1 [Helianthus annuus]KAJ0839301.1 putative PAMP-induced secreted peptide 1 [Helianthus annuus]
MTFKNACTLLVFLVILIAVISPLVVEVEGRVLSEDFAGANHLATYSTVYEKAKTGMSFWLQRLESGPSPSGPGH